MNRAAVVGQQFRALGSNMIDIEIVNGCFLRRFGAPGKSKIICLAGFADNGTMFAPISDTSLAREFELIAVDLPGFGAAPRQAGVDTIASYGKVVVELARAISPDMPVGLVGHSIASAIAVCAAQLAPSAISGVFSIEGNLTRDDAYFSGKAADWDDAGDFKQWFLDSIWKKAQSQNILRRYYAAAVMSDAVSMWQLGQDAKKISVGDNVGEAYLSLKVPSLYYWSKDNTPESTQAFIATRGPENHEYSGASHWPTVDAPVETAEVIRRFFSA